MRWMVREALRQDWVTRSDTLRVWKVTHPRLYEELCGRLAPDQALGGTCGGISGWPANLPIPLQDRSAGTKRQTRLTEFFEVKRRRGE